MSAQAATASEAAAVPRLPRRLSMSRRLSLTFDLPHGGEYYEHVVTADRVGIMFFKARELVNVLLSADDREIISGLKDRPVVTFMFQNSPGKEAGVELGHVLCKVNGQSVVSPQDATEKIRAAERPMTLFFYVPDWSTIHCAEGELMVKYDTKDLDVPFSLKEWQKKYVVVGGMLGCGNPPKLKMYNSKRDYDTAVLERNALKDVSVEVVEFDLSNIQIEKSKDGDEDQTIAFAGTPIPLTYIVVTSTDGKRCPMKLASFEPFSLRPVHNAIRKVIQSQEPLPASTGMKSGGANVGTDEAKGGVDEVYGYFDDDNVGIDSATQQPATDSAKDSTSVEEVRKSLSKATVTHEDSEAAKRRGSFGVLNDYWGGDSDDSE